MEKLHKLLHNFRCQDLTGARIETPIGSMLAVSDEQALYLLEFIENWKTATEGGISFGKTDPIRSIKEELDCYFSNRLTHFKTPFKLFGTPFQKRVWEELRAIPYGETRSYAEIAKRIGKPTGYRALAQANGKNRLPILIPCHRVINTGGGLGGYAGGLPRKQWMLDHEQGALVEEGNSL